MIYIYIYKFTEQNALNILDGEYQKWREYLRNLFRYQQKSKGKKHGKKLVESEEPVKNIEDEAESF